MIKAIMFQLDRFRDGQVSGWQISGWQISGWQISESAKRKDRQNRNSVNPDQNSVNPDQSNH